MSQIQQLINNFSNQNLIHFLRSKIPSFKPEEVSYDEWFEEEKFQKYQDIKKIGEADIDQDDLIVITAKTTDILTERSSKKRQYDIAKKILKQEVKDSALFVFYDEEGNFRFSFIRANYLGKRRDFTDFKRYTYYVSPRLTNKTFIKQVDACDFSSLDAIIEAFSVEPLNKEFYREIAKAFYSLIGGTVRIANHNESYNTQLQLPSHPHNAENRKLYQEFAVRLIGRTIFTWFLKNKKSQAGIPLIPESWLSSKTVAKIIGQKKNYYHDYLEKLFFLVLNKKTEDRDASILPVEHEIIPFLNGGLFEAQLDDFFNFDSQGNPVISYHLKIPNQWFLDLFKTLEQFNFTIDENSIYDAEVSIDPEMLGTIFENLLAEIDPDTENSARNASGSFYTPREVVDYMVEQSLIQALINKTQIDNEEAFAQLFKEGGKNQFNQQETIQILQALNRLKIIDPACGSGAFPMGALHKIIMALKKLDPGARWWKQQQLKKIDNALVRKQLEEKLNQSNSDYIRKLGVIQHSIYGVDIQSIATEISKLRSFLSLVIDENIIDEAYNRGIEPLPNLEFKFVTANTLLKLEEKDQTMFDFGQTAELQEQLQQIRKEYLQAYGQDKERLKKAYRDIQKIIFEREIQAGAPGKRVEQLTSWDPFSHDSAGWFDPEWMFGIENFDIVIGNPPYRDYRKLDKPTKNSVQNFYSYINSLSVNKPNLYIYFIERAFDFMSKKGILSFINPNQMLIQESSFGIRKFLIKKSRIYYINDLSYIKVFKEAATYPIIWSCQNNILKEYKLKIGKITKLSELNFFDYLLNIKDVIKDDKFKIITSKHLSLIKKIESKSNKLKKICQTAIVGTSKGGFGKKKITTKEYNLLNDENKKGYIKFLESSDIFRYMIKYRGYFIPKDIYSRKRLQVFLNNKIIVARMTNNIRAYLDLDNYALGKVNLLSNFSLSEKFILGLLNSKLIDFWYRNTFDALHLQGGGLGYELPYFLEIPIKEISPISEILFIKLVDQIIAGKEAGTDTTALERRIDLMVYKLYELTYNEVKIIDPAFEMKREDYEKYKNVNKL